MADTLVSGTSDRKVMRVQLPPSAPFLLLLLAALLPAQTVVDRITAVVNGQVVMLSEVRLMQSLQSGSLTFDEARDRVVREKLRLQDIAKFAVYTFSDESVLKVLTDSGLPDTPEHRGAVRRALIINKHITQRYAPLVSISDAQVADFLDREYPIHSIRPGSSDWEKARKAAGAEALEGLVQDWDRRLRESATVRLFSDSGE